MPALKSRSNSLAGLTLDAVLGGEIVIPPPPPLPPPLPQKSLERNRITTQTLFDIIREEYIKEGQKDRTTWQIFREKLRLKRSGSAWTSSLHIPTSDILIPNTKHVGPTCAFPMSDPAGSSGRGMFTRGPSMRVGSGKKSDDDVSIPGDGPSSKSFKPQFSRHDSVRDHGDGEEDNRRHHPVVTFSDERTMSARDAVAAQEAAEAAAAEESDEEEEEDDDEDNDSGEADEKKSSTASAPKQTMSLMDLLEVTGSSYAMDDEEEEYEEDGDENYEEEEDDGQGGGGEGEINCCVCKEKIKGASFTPCGHTFCKLCSKELMAQKGHCPICSSFVLEFLEIF